MQWYYFDDQLCTGSLHKKLPRVNNKITTQRYNNKVYCHFCTKPRYFLITLTQNTGMTMRVTLMPRLSNILIAILAQQQKKQDTWENIFIGNYNREYNFCLPFWTHCV